MVIEPNGKAVVDLRSAFVLGQTTLVFLTSPIGTTDDTPVSKGGRSSVELFVPIPYAGVVSR